MNRLRSGRRGWPVKIVDPSVRDIEDLGDAVSHLEKELETSPYGRCAWHCEEHDVFDTQVANVGFSNGSMATMKMAAHSERLCDRFTTIYCTEGEMEIDMAKSSVRIRRFADGRGRDNPWKSVDVDKSEPLGQTTNHSGADYYCIKAFAEAVRTGDKSKLITDAMDSLKSHELVFNLQETSI